MCKYVVVDLEMCNVPKEYKYKGIDLKQEIIQIGAVLLNESYEIVDKFDTYVFPKYGVIDQIVEKITGIHQRDLMDAPKFEEAFEQFIKWIPRDVKFVEWSRSDELQFFREIESKNIEVDRIDFMERESWIDCQKMFGDNIDLSRAYNLMEAVTLSGIDYMDGAHDGYVDAYNTALLFAKLKLVPEFIKDTFYGNLGIEKENLNYTLGDLFAGFQVNCCA